MVLIFDVQHEDLEFTKVLGVGTYGKVYKGLYKKQKVAIKVLTTEGTALDYECKKELEVMR
jgi:predicted Ser/Thr protein kinase